MPAGFASRLATTSLLDPTLFDCRSGCDVVTGATAVGAGCALRKKALNSAVINPLTATR